jgi:hypothetical protein
MITIFVETQRIYAHDGNGMPKIEKIEQSFSEVVFGKFLKYLPFQHYLTEKLRVTRVEDWVNSKFVQTLDKEPYQKQLLEVVATIGKTEPTVVDQLESEKKRNDELMERLAVLEARLNVQPVETEPESNGYNEMKLYELREEYQKKFGKNPSPAMKKETIIEKLNA